MPAIILLQYPPSTLIGFEYGHSKSSSAGQLENIWLGSFSRYRLLWFTHSILIWIALTVPVHGVPSQCVCLSVIILHSAAGGDGISHTYFLPASSVTYKNKSEVVSPLPPCHLSDQLLVGFLYVFHDGMCWLPLVKWSIRLLCSFGYQYWFHLEQLQLTWLDWFGTNLSNWIVSSSLRCSCSFSNYPPSRCTCRLVYFAICPVLNVLIITNCAEHSLYFLWLCFPLFLQVGLLSLAWVFISSICLMTMGNLFQGRAID